MDLIDSHDEELGLRELNLERAVNPPRDPSPQAATREARTLEVKELFRLQGELLKLQDWVTQAGRRS